jgi:hypothetical protein
METRPLTEKERSYAEQLGRDMAAKRRKGTVNLIDELEK